jgi:endonuclease YncB( thermonuclease family)
MGNLSSYKNQNKQLDNQLDQQINWTKYNFTNTDNHTLNNQNFICRVVDIYDGDTCICILPLYNSFYKFNIRLADIDTCEIKSKVEYNKNLALLARMRLYELIIGSKSNLDLEITRKDLRTELNNNVYLIKLMCGEFDKYGRLLGWLFDINNTDLSLSHDKSFNHILINEKLAYLYNGKTKLTEDDQVNILKN